MRLQDFTLLFLVSCGKPAPRPALRSRQLIDQHYGLQLSQHTVLMTHLANKEPPSFLSINTHPVLLKLLRHSQTVGGPNHSGPFASFATCVNKKSGNTRLTKALVTW